MARSRKMASTGTATGKGAAALGAIQQDAGAGSNTKTGASVKSTYLGATYPPVVTDPNGITVPLIGPNGKAITTPVTGQQFLDYISLPANQKFLDAYRALGIAGDFPFDPPSANGKVNKITANDKAALQIVMANATGLSSNYVAGQPADPVGTIKAGIQSIANSPWLQPTTISRNTFDQPNVQASNKVVNDIFTTLLGRGATDSELQAYANAYTKYAAANPITTESGTVKYTEATNPSGNLARMKSSQDYTDVQNNLNEQAFVENQVRNSGEYNAYTAASTAFNMMQQLAAANRAGQ